MTPRISSGLERRARQVDPLVQGGITYYPRWDGMTDIATPDTRTGQDRRVAALERQIVQGTIDRWCGATVMYREALERVVLALRKTAAVPVVDLEKEAKLRDALDTLVTLAPTRHQIERLGALEPDAIVGEAEAYALEWMLAVDAAKRLLAAVGEKP